MTSVAAAGEQVDDLSLVAAAVAGDQAAARAFYERHASACFRLAVARLRDAAMAEDVVHDAFEAVWRQASDGPMQGGRDGTLRGLMLTITHRRALDVVRSAWSRRRDGRAEVPDVEDAEDGPLERVERASERERVHLAVQRIDEPYRTVLLLDLAGHDNATVAELTGRRPNTVAQQRRRALARLRDVLVDASPAEASEADGTFVTTLPSPVASSGGAAARSTPGGGGVA